MNWVPTAPDRIVANVTSGLGKSRRPCFLLEVPPGCKELHLLSACQRAFAKHAPEDVAHAKVDIDLANNESELIEELINQWTACHVELREVWGGRPMRNRGPDHMRLMHFGATAKRAGVYLVVFIQRFDKVFRWLSSQFLAAMRNLEHERCSFQRQRSPLSATQSSTDGGLSTNRGLPQTTASSTFGYGAESWIRNAQ